MHTIYTIGHSNYPVERLIELLRQHKIELAADVRQYPSSRRYPQFNRANLEKSLKDAGIEYKFIGDKLGGLDDYEVIKSRPEFKEGIEQMCEISKLKRTALLCAEEDPYKCHRHQLLEPAFVKSEVTIRHIRGSGLLENERQAKLF